MNLNNREGLLSEKQPSRGVLKKRCSENTHTEVCFQKNCVKNLFK